MENFKLEEGSDPYFLGLAYDRQGSFYAVSEFHATGPNSDQRRSLVKKLTGEEALTWFAQNASWDATFARELCRAIDNPQFEFMPLVPVRVPPKRKRKARRSAFRPKTRGLPPRPPTRINTVFQSNRNDKQTSSVGN